MREDSCYSSVTSPNLRSVPSVHEPADPTSDPQLEPPPSPASALAKSREDPNDMSKTGTPRRSAIVRRGLAVIGAIVGEFIGGGGLGALVDAVGQMAFCFGAH
mgnify:CR=1 FL=1